MSSRPCVGLVAPAFDRGGLEQVVLDLYRAYRRAGWDCLVLVESAEMGELAAEAAPDDVIVLGGDERLFSRALADRRPVVLHYHHATLGLREATALGLFTVYTLHRVYSWMEPDAFAARAASIAAARRVTAVSTFARDYFLARSGLPLSVEVVANGVDPASVAAGARPVGRAELAVPEDGFLFITPAGLFAAKHQIAAIAAMERLDDRARLLLIGRDLDPDYAAAVRARWATSPARARITLAPAIPRARMGALYRTADALLLPSLLEGSSNVVREALLHDLPMVLTDVGDAQEAAALSARVRVVARAYGELRELTPLRLHQLSREPQPRNASELAAAMGAVMIDPGPSATADEMEARRSELSVAAVAERYLALFEDAPLLFRPALSA